MDATLVSILTAVNYLLERNPSLIFPLGKILEDLERRQSMARRHHSLNSIDQKLEKYLGYEDGYFVELGANDGISQSNTLYFESEKNWHGVLIEPLLNKYFECLANRSAVSKVYCNACVPFTYTKPYVEMIYVNLMSIAPEIAHEIKDAMSHAEIGERFLPEKHRKTKYFAVASTLNCILDLANAPTLMDLLSIDVEGSEISVLNGLDHKKYRFKYICCETRDLEKMTSYMATIDYVYVEHLSEHDLLFRCRRSNF